MLPQSLIGPILIVLVLLGLGGQVIPLYTDYLWFQEVKLASVFTTMLWIKLVLFFAAGLLFAALVYVNVYLAARSTASDVLVELEDPFGLPSRLVIEPLFRRFLLPASWSWDSWPGPRPPGSGRASSSSSTPSRSTSRTPCSAATSVFTCSACRSWRRCTPGP